MRPWKGWVIVSRTTGTPAPGLFNLGPQLFRTEEQARASLRLDLGLDANTHEVVRVVLRDADTTDAQRYAAHVEMESQAHAKDEG